MIQTIDRCWDCRVGTQLQFGNVEGMVAKNKFELEVRSRFENYRVISLLKPLKSSSANKQVDNFILNLHHGRLRHSVIFMFNE